MGGRWACRPRSVPAAAEKDILSWTKCARIPISSSRRSQNNSLNQPRSSFIRSARNIASPGKSSSCTSNAIDDRRPTPARRFGQFPALAAAVLARRQKLSAPREYGVGPPWQGGKLEPARDCATLNEELVQIIRNVSRGRITG